MGRWKKIAGRRHKTILYDIRQGEGSEEMPGGV